MFLSSDLHVVGDRAIAADDPGQNHRARIRVGVGTDSNTRIDYNVSGNAYALTKICL